MFFSFFFKVPDPKLKCNCQILLLQYSIQSTGFAFLISTQFEFSKKKRLLRKGGKRTIFLFWLLFSLSCLINRDISVFLPSHSKGYTTRWEFLLNSHKSSGLYFHASILCVLIRCCHVFVSYLKKGGTIFNLWSLGGPSPQNRLPRISWQRRTKEIWEDQKIHEQKKLRGPNT